MVSSPDDRGERRSQRDRVLIRAHNGYIDYPVSKQVELPANWAELRQQAHR
jgi:hypothetical protein